MNYVPERGDLVKIDFNPQAGHEQFGWRQAIVISPKEYNQMFGLALLCPITSEIKNLPFEVPVPNDLPIYGVVLSDHLKSLDWRARNIKFECSITNTHPAFLDEVLARIETLVT